MSLGSILEAMPVEYLQEMLVPVKYEIFNPGRLSHPPDKYQIFSLLSYNSAWLLKALL